MLDNGEKFYGPLRNARVIYNGRNEQIFSWKNKRRYIFCMGRLWDESTNIRTLLKAAAKVNFPVFIAGENSERMADLPGNVHLLRHLPPSQIVRWLSEASIYFLPVRYEPFGYSFLEAALSGCAIITGDIPSMHEIWEDTVEYVDPENPEQMAMKINRLMRNRLDMIEIAMKSHKRALQRYSLDKMLHSYALLYENVYKENVVLF
jgi:glycosyltransferase involved in cell wall biosynthesis